MPSSMRTKISYWLYALLVHFCSRQNDLWYDKAELLFSQLLQRQGIQVPFLISVHLLVCALHLPPFNTASSIHPHLTRETNTITITKKQNWLSEETHYMAGPVDITFGIIHAVCGLPYYQPKEPCLFSFLAWGQNLRKTNSLPIPLAGAVSSWGSPENHKPHRARPISLNMKQVSLWGKC